MNEKIKIGINIVIIHGREWFSPGQSNGTSDMNIVRTHLLTIVLSSCGGGIDSVRRLVFQTAVAYHHSTKLCAIASKPHHTVLGPSR
jgi:hypothetical protein